MKSNAYRHYDNYNDYNVFITKQKLLKNKCLVEDVGINKTVKNICMIS